MPAPQRGKFITFEGLDGVGKSTQMQNLAAALRQRGIAVVTTREPGGTALGAKLRAVVLNSAASDMSPLAELALMFADRAQHIDEQILPALQSGQWVLCDRFTDSSDAYQGGGRQLGSSVVLELHRLLCRDLQPDLTILMVSDLARSIARARRRNARPGQTEKDEGRFERENRAFYERVLAAYLAAARRDPQRIVRVDATSPIAQVQKRIITIVEDRFLREKPGAAF
ncbi:MAG TPA: dTMP kinase [Candidatus Angelobacter sp.]|nr:dTMP kinase [Candidatus Angelobacter sp.]